MVNVHKKEKLEISFVFFILITFLIVGVVLSSRIHRVWFDEVAFIDPAMNLYLGKGFTSTATRFPKENFYTDSTLLYPVVVFLWMKIFGPSITAVRSLNYVLIVASVAMIYQAVVNLNLIKSPWLRVALVLILLSSQGVTWNYVSVRYDCLSTLLCAATFLVCTTKQNTIRNSLLIFLGFLFPLSGLSLVAYSVILMALLLLFERKKLAKEFLFICFGIALGTIFLFLLYNYYEVWEQFWSHSSGHSIVKDVSAEDNNFVGKLIVKLSAVTRLLDNSSYVCSGCIRDKSYRLLFFLVVFLLAYQIITRKITVTSVFGFTASLFIPLLMCFLGKYPVYYSWMAFIPLAIAVCSSFDQILNRNTNRAATIIILAIFSISVLGSFAYGLPKKVIATFQNWHGNNYAAIEQFIDQNLQATDIVYADYSAFYAVKAKVDQVYFPRYIRNPKRTDIHNTTVLLIDPLAHKKWKQQFHPEFGEIAERIGGEWIDTQQEIQQGPYYLKIYRRINS